MISSQDASFPDNDSTLSWGASIGIFCAALAVRLLVLFQLRHSPMFEVLIGDARGYSQWAAELAAGNWLGDEVFYQAPLYPYLLGLVYSAVGTSAMAIRLGQAVLGAFSCLLLARAGSRFFNRQAGLATGLLLAVYAPAVYYDTLLQKASVAFFFLSLGLYLVSRLLRRPRMHLAGFLGFTIGLLVLTRENSLVFVPALALTLLISPKLPFARRAGMLILFSIGLGAALLPVAARNLHVGGGFHLTTSQLGTNLYIGNNATTDGRYQPLRPGRGDPRYERIDARELAEAGAGRSLTPSEVSQYWVGRALEYVRSNPVDWVALLGRKLLLAWNAAEVNDTEDLYTYADHSIFLRIIGSVFHFGILAPLAFIGVCATGSERRRLWPLYLLLISYMASLVIFYVFGRYRYPMVPFLALFAGAGLAEFPRIFLDGVRARAAVVGAGAVLVLVICNLPLLSKDGMRATTYRNLGTAFAEEGEYEKAVTLHMKALEYNPESSAAHFNLANALAADDQPHRAIEHYQRAIALDPDYAGAYGNLGNVYRDLGRFEQAVDAYLEAITLSPGAVEAYNNLGVTFAMQGQYARAIASFREALRIGPDFGPARANLERALRQQERLQLFEDD